VREIERRLSALEERRIKTHRRAVVVLATDEQDRDNQISSMLAAGQRLNPPQ
jgi:hypothetical protein